LIDYTSEHTFPLLRLRLEINLPISPATCWRWALRGVRGRRLETFLIGGRRYTSREAVDRFLNHLNGPRAAQEAPSKARARQIARARERAEAIF
jgi:hypothetical protein